ncbi:acyl-coenzyme A thioesterase 13 [Brachionus plicatilis]|uniref:Acyl-coenzyme A thioesterase 13 n=1 Tax=Brachionus plicatilis TaxID=10195 RepID=A0A3M7SDL7_BRAPC|nr:acyl-coenzyme A thioesterase 13 [Brachionus plicatilis]
MDEINSFDNIENSYHMFNIFNPYSNINYLYKIGIYEPFFLPSGFLTEPALLFYLNFYYKRYHCEVYVRPCTKYPIHGIKACVAKQGDTWKVISAPENKGSCLFQIKVDESLVNINKTIHGGAVATLLDMTTTAALFNTPLRKPGVSVDMNISYLKPARLNETILIDAQKC